MLQIFSLALGLSRCKSDHIGDVQENNQVVRTLKSQYVDERFWPPTEQQRILGMPGASSYRNSNDKPSQRAHVLFLVEDRKLPQKSSYHSSGYDLKQKDSSTRGSIIDYESPKTQHSQPRLLS